MEKKLVIAIEGIDGVGKTTLINRLQKTLHPYLFSFEFGREPNKNFRERFFTYLDADVDTKMEWMKDSRMDTILRQCHGPDTYITDRWDISTLVYQAIPHNKVRELNDSVKYERYIYDYDVKYIIVTGDPDVCYNRLLNEDREINSIDRMSKEEYMELYNRMEDVIAGQYKNVPTITNSDKLIVTDIEKEFQDIVKTILKWSGIERDDFYEVSDISIKIKPEIASQYAFDDIAFIGECSRLEKEFNTILPVAYLRRDSTTEISNLGFHLLNLSLWRIISNVNSYLMTYSYIYTFLAIIGHHLIQLDVSDNSQVTVIVQYTFRKKQYCKSIYVDNSGIRY